MHEGEVRCCKPFQLPVCRVAQPFHLPARGLRTRGAGARGSPQNPQIRQNQKAPDPRNATRASGPRNHWAGNRTPARRCWEASPRSRVGTSRLPRVDSGEFVRISDNSVEHSARSGVQRRSGARRWRIQWFARVTTNPRVGRGHGAPATTSGSGGGERKEIEMESPAALDGRTAVGIRR